MSISSFPIHSLTLTDIAKILKISSLDHLKLRSCLPPFAVQINPSNLLTGHLFAIPKAAQEIDTTFVAKVWMETTKDTEKEEVTFCVPSALRERQIMKDGARLSHVRVLAPRVLSASMVAWESIDTETIEDLRTEKNVM